MKLSHLKRRVAQARSGTKSTVSQEANLTEAQARLAGWLKNKMDSFSAWQTRNNNWFNELAICGEEAQEYISKNYGYVETVKTTSKYAERHLSKARNSAEVLTILKSTHADAQAFLKAAEGLVKSSLSNPDKADLSSLDVKGLSHYEDMLLDGDLKAVTVATISPRDFMTFYKLLGNLERDFKTMTDEFARSQPAMRNAVQDLEDGSLKAALNNLIDFRMRSLDIYRRMMESIAYYCRDSLSRVTTNPDEIPSKENYPVPNMRTAIGRIRANADAMAKANNEALARAEAERLASLEDHDVNISVSQDNDQQTEPDPVAGTGEDGEVDLDKLKADGEKAKEENAEEQLVTDAAQAAQIDDIAQSVDTLESALVDVRNLQTLRYVPREAIEAVQATVTAALEGRSVNISVPSYESLVLDRNYELNRLERELTVALEGLVDDVKIWVAKQIDTVNSKFNWSKLYDQLSTTAANIKERTADNLTVAADVEDYRVPLPGETVRYLAHAEKASDIPKVWTDYTTGLGKVLTGSLANLDTAMAKNIEFIMRGNRSNDEIAKDFFSHLSGILHIDGSYIGYGWQGTFGNKIRKLFGRHLKWEPATFDDSKYAKVTAVWAMHPKFINQAVDEFLELLTIVKNFETSAPTRREALRKSIVNTIDIASKSADDKAKSKAIRNAKSLYSLVLDTEAELDKYLHFTMIEMSEYLFKSSQYKTVVSNQ